MYPYPSRAQSQAPSQPPPPPSGYGRGPSASQSPEQTRASLGRPVPHSPSGMSSHSHHGGPHSIGSDDGWHRGPEMREVHYPPPPQSRYGSGRGDRDRDDFGGRPPPPWLDDRPYGPPPPHSSRQPPPPPPQDRSGQQRMMDERGRMTPGYGPPPPSFSHPPSPSHRPRTPPPLSRNGTAGSGGRPSSWDPVASGPMSAPPSMVPRMPPNSSAGSAGGAGMHHPRASSQHTSPLLPGLSGTSRATGESGSGHHRMPSWGPPSNKESNAMQAAGLTSPSRGGSVGAPAVGPSSAAYRGASMDPLGRSESSSLARPIDSRKRPASESPPTSTAGPTTVQQSSPSQRGDVMSMSSILGPSSGRAPSGPSSDSSAEKRRRLEGGHSGSASPSKLDYSNAAGAASASSRSAANSNALSMSEAAAVNLARRKWSGPIAEEAAQQAAAWRAQEQRWGTGTASRSPKVGMLPLGSGPSGSERHTSPFGSLSNLTGRGASPMQEGHRRQRSDGLQMNQVIDSRSPLVRAAPLRGPPSPPPQAQPPMSAAPGPSGGRAPSKQQQQQQQQHPSQRSPQQQQLQQGYGPGGPPSYYRGASPPPLPHAQQGVPMPGHQPPQGPHFSQQGPPPPQVYGQPSYHAYDSQGRPVEIDVDEVRGGAFAGHGNAPPPPHMNDAAFRHGMAPPPPPPFDEPRGRMVQPPPSQPQQPPMRREGPTPMVPQSGKGGHAQASSKQGPSARESKANAIASQQASAQQVARAQQQQQQAREREREIKASRRSVTPVMPGPARGLLPPRFEQHRTNATPSGRPVVPSKDFNSGPKVDSDAVWAALKEGDEMPRGAVTTNGRSDDPTTSASQDVGSAPDDLVKLEQTAAVRRHLGSFLYDARKSPLLSGELLQRNIGATLEVRIPGRLLGVGPSSADDHAGISHGRWGLGPKASSASAKESVDRQANGKATDESEMAEEKADAQAFWNNEAILKRKAWGTDVYTDDSDVLVMCLHAGWLQGPAMDDVPSWVPPGKAVLAWRRMTDDLAKRGVGFEENQHDSVGKPSLNGDTSHDALEQRLERLKQTMDLSVTLRVAPRLIAYKGSQRGGVKTRSWGNTHDGVSLVIESVSLQPPGYGSGERGLRSMKQRIDQLARLKMLASIAGDAGPLPSEGTRQHAQETTGQGAVKDAHPSPNAVRQHMVAGGLLDILAAAQLTAAADQAGNNDAQIGVKRFWQFDPLLHIQAA